MKTVTFICTGNTCRSVMGEKILSKMVREKGLSGLNVQSAGTAAIPGYSIYGDLKTALDIKGIEYSGHIPRMVDRNIMEESDIILAMTREHSGYLKERFSEYADKVFMLSEFAGAGREDIPDPIGQGVETYLRVYDSIEEYLVKMKERLFK